MTSTKAEHRTSDKNETERVYHLLCCHETCTKGGPIMSWEAPSFVEVKMDAEINSYQDDFRGLPEAKGQPAETPVPVIPTNNDGWGE
jgi:hypothetical protein